MSKFNPMRHRIPLLKRLVPSVRRRIWRWRHPGGFGVVESQGARFLLNPENFVDRQVAFYDDFEEAQIGFLSRQVAMRRCELFLDVGAAFGYYSIIFARRFPSLAVVAFEPDTRNADQFRANLDLNGLADRVTLHRAAASATAGTVGFRPGPAASTGQSAIDTDAMETAVAARPIDGVIDVATKSIAAKIDVEGHELDVLRGLERTLRDNRCVLQIETYRDQIARVSDFLSGLGFSPLNRIEHDHYFVNFVGDTESRARTEP